MRKFTTKLLMSLIAVAFAIVALGTSTYAWFTLSGTATAGKFDADVRSAEGLEFSISEKAATTEYSALNWKTSTTTAEMVEFLDLETDFVFNNVTSSDGKAMKGIDGVAAAAANTTDGGWISFDLHFKVTDPDGGDKKKVYLDVSACDFDSEGIDWTMDANIGETTGNFKLGTTSEWKAINAARISFVQSGTVKNIYAPAVGNGSETDGKVEKYNVAKSFKNDVNPDAADYDADTYTMVTDIAKVGDLKYQDYAAKVTTKEMSDVTTDLDFEVCECTGTANPGGISTLYGTVTINIWLEGWDSDCINAIMGDNVWFKFVFTISPKTE